MHMNQMVHKLEDEHQDDPDRVPLRCGNCGRSINPKLTELFIISFITKSPAVLLSRVFLGASSTELAI